MSIVHYRDIPVVLVVAGKKVDYISHVVENLSKHCGFRLFYVICPENDLGRAIAHSSAIVEEEVVVIDEDFINPGLSLSEVTESLNYIFPNFSTNHLSGWYLQQFLKMGFAKYAPNCEYYLIWDVDTLLTRSVGFFEGNKILLTQGNEYHKEYFDTISHLFNGIQIQAVSHISQHLMVRTADMIELIDALLAPNNKWWQKILYSLNGNTPFQFSEYETYANFCLNYKANIYKSRKLRWFRYGKSYFGCDLPYADIKLLKGLYVFISFEDWDEGWKRKVRSRLQVIAHSLAKRLKY